MNYHAKELQLHEIKVGTYIHVVGTGSWMRS